MGWFGLTTERLAGIAGKYSSLCNTGWPITRSGSAIILWILVRLDLGKDVAVPTSLLLYAMVTIVLDLICCWRDHDLYLMLAYGRQCTHHTSGANTNPVYIGVPFSQVLWFFILVLMLLQLGTIIPVATVSGLSEFTTLWVVLRIVAALQVDLIDLAGRGIAIRYSHETAYMNAQIKGQLQYAIAALHPEWTPLYGYQFFVLVSPDESKLSVDFGDYNGEAPI